MSSKFEEFARDERQAVLLEQENLVFQATEVICALMEASGVSRSSLAEQLGTSKANISQLLDGSRNMTLKTLAELAFTLGHRIRLESNQITSESSSESRTKLTSERVASKALRFQNNRYIYVPCHNSRGPRDGEELLVGANEAMVA